MRVRQVRVLLWGLTAGAAAGAVGVLFAGLKLPLAASPPQSVRVAPISSPPAEAPALPPLEWFEPGWRAALRGPAASDDTIAASPHQSTKPAAPMLRLVGTIMDARRPRGIFVVGLASIEVKAVGDKAGGADILRIDDNAATVSFNGATFT